MKYVYVLSKYCSGDDLYSPRSAHPTKKAAEAQVVFNGWKMSDCLIERVEFYG